MRLYEWFLKIEKSILLNADLCSPDRNGNPGAGICLFAAVAGKSDQRKLLARQLMQQMPAADCSV